METTQEFNEQELRNKYKDRDPVMVGLLIELRKIDKRVWFMDEYLKLKHEAFQ